MDNKSNETTELNTNENNSTVIDISPASSHEEPEIETTPDEQKIAGNDSNMFTISNRNTHTQAENDTSSLVNNIIPDGYKNSSDKLFMFGSLSILDADLLPNEMESIDKQYCDFILHLRHVASFKAEFDIYQILAFRAMIDRNSNRYLKPLKFLQGLVSNRYSDLQIRWLNSFQRVFLQALITGCIQTIGVTAILVTQFLTYFASSNSQCDYEAVKWQEEVHLKILAFLWTAYISAGVSGWVYRARHSGFYHMFNFLETENYPNFISVTYLQIGLMINYYVVTSAVIGSYILIYQTEGGYDTINIVLQAVALFFVLELDNRIVHARDFKRIVYYMNEMIENEQHLTIPMGSSATNISSSAIHQPMECCYGKSSVEIFLGVTSWILLMVMSVVGIIAPIAILICW